MQYHHSWCRLARVNAVAELGAGTSNRAYTSCRRTHSCEYAVCSNSSYRVAMLRHRISRVGSSCHLAQAARHT